MVGGPITMLGWLPYRTIGSRAISPYPGRSSENSPASQKSFQTRMPSSSQAWKNSARVLDPIQFRIVVRLMPRCVPITAHIFSGDIRSSSSSQPQSPPRQNTFEDLLTVLWQGVRKR
ncbi:hypothetical protein F1D05_13070 [Kribbella qitaiheensis]|uniref:Uncharacterized protein n=1 Tax=Kribbella qitaiheensis TaxID=1544730 RepID=A0A7G6WXF6_9ACTN|nr:hypothetical protein [Kribbella qitaiheensis]QNE18671.1 hypothetical protein F1D05_13070 [Kribbella qitaiheensis]